MNLTEAPPFRPDVDMPRAVTESDAPIINFSGPGFEMDRRHFLKLSGLASGGLILAFSFLGTSRARASENGGKTIFDPNGFLQISPDGKILIYAISPEIGQGVKTSLPMIVAEELDVPWESVTVEQSEINYEVYGPQYAGGSMATSTHFNRLRKAGATARFMLVTAAAKKWGVPAETCTTGKAAVRHEATGKSISYADICSEAASQSMPSDSDLVYKERKDYQLLGTWKTGVDNLPIVTGKPLFGMDLQIPGMRYAIYVKCPSFGGKVAEANLEAVKAAPGIVDAFVLEGNGNPTQLLSGVAIIAESTWTAFNAANMLKVKWDRTDAAKETWSDFVDQAKTIVEKDGPTTKTQGDFAEAETEAAQVVESFYHYPFVSHVTMEPMNCTAHYKDGKLEIWAPTQTPQSAPNDATAVTGIAQSDIKIHQLRIGGGFGRRLLNDYVAEVAAIAQRVDAPVKLVWTREQDTTHDFYRVGGFYKLKGTLDGQGNLSGWKQHFVTFTEGGKNRNPVRGGGLNEWAFPYPFVPSLQLEETRLDLKIPCGWWRAPGSCTQAWVIQSFLHELSSAAGRDHLEFLLDLMGPSRWLQEGNSHALHTGRAANVIKLVAEKAGWGSPLPEGHGRGLAFYFSHQGHFAEVAEVSVDASRKLKLHKVVAAGDVGLVINKSGAKNQVEGSIVDGYSAILGQQVTFTDGAVDQSNFHDYSLLQMQHHPEIEVHMIESDFPPTGLGEPALPPLGPAVCNAIFDATGIRVKTLPLTEEGFSV